MSDEIYNIKDNGKIKFLEKDLQVITEFPL